jgi:hypothetical protein
MQTAQHEKMTCKLAGGRKSLLPYDKPGAAHEDEGKTPTVGMMYISAVYILYQGQPSSVAERCSST